MIRREKQALLRLEKISEASSPSPSREHKPEEASRINPLVLTTINPPRPVQVQDSRALQITVLQEQIMDRKNRLRGWEEAYEYRMGHRGNDVDDQVKKVMVSLVSLGKNDILFKYSLVKALKGGKKGVIGWILGWMQKIFWLISMILINRKARLD